MINLRLKKQCQKLIFLTMPIRWTSESLFQVSTRFLWEDIKLSPQLSLTEAKYCLCKAQYSSCCEWVCILDVCVCACLCVLWIASDLSWITFAVGVYRMVGWHAVSQRSLEITRLAGVWILTMCACMRVHSQVLFGILVDVFSHLNCKLFLSSEWLTD